MAYNHEYPYINTKEYNDDWLIHSMHDLKQQWESTLGELDDKFAEYQKQIDDFTNSITTQWTDFQSEYVAAWNEYKTSLTDEWNTYRTVLTKAWQDFQTAEASKWTEYTQDQEEKFNTFKTGIEATQDAFQTEILKDISDLEVAWSQYKTQVNASIAQQNTKIAELQTYVNNYFQNLDVQSEINTKLDGLVADGTMANLINQEVLGDIQSQVDGLKFNNRKFLLLGENFRGPTVQYFWDARFRSYLNITEGDRCFTIMSSGNCFFENDDAYNKLLTWIGSKTKELVDSITDVIVISNGLGATIDTSTLATNVNKLGQYIRDNMPSANAHLMCAGWSNDLEKRLEIANLYNNFNTSVVGFSIHDDIWKAMYKCNISTRQNDTVYTSSNAILFSALSVINVLGGGNVRFDRNPTVLEFNTYNSESLAKVKLNITVLNDGIQISTSRNYISAIWKLQTSTYITGRIAQATVGTPAFLNNNVLIPASFKIFDKDNANNTERVPGFLEIVKTGTNAPYLDMVLTGGGGTSFPYSVDQVSFMCNAFIPFLYI